MFAMRPQHNSTRSARKIAFDLVSECSRLSPILRCDQTSASGSEATADQWFNERAVDSGDSDDKRTDSDEKSQADDEIPIWICGEPRYISGITAGTQCREIIQALIDDELHSEEGAAAGQENCRQSMRHNKDNRRGSSSNKAREFAAASRDLADYVITERWRDVEQALAAETPILPIWLAWGTARNEVRFKLKINKSKDTGRGRGRNHEADDVALQPKKPKKTHKLKALAKMMKRLVLQSETIQERLSQLRPIEYRVSEPTAPTGKAMLLDHFLYDSATSCDVAAATARPPPAIAPEPRVLENIYVHLYEPDNPIEPINIQSSTDDELFLLIDDNARTSAGGAPTEYRSDDLDSGVHVEYRQYVLNRKLQSTARAAAANHCLSHKLLQLSETPKRKYRRRCDFDRLRARSLNRRAVATPPRAAPAQKPPRPSLTAATAAARQMRAACSSRRDTIRLEVARRLLDLDELLHYEQQLQQRLAQRSQQFREQNELYRGGQSVFVANDVEQIQRRLAACTADIVDGECALFRLQLEITQKCGVLHNLQRMQAIAEEAADAEAEESSSNATVASTVASGSAMCAARIEAEQRRHCEQMRGAVDGEEEDATDVGVQVLETTVFVDNVHEFCDRNKSIIV